MTMVEEARERCSGDASYREFTRAQTPRMDGGGQEWREGRSVYLPSLAHQARQRKTPYTDSEDSPIYEGDILHLEALIDVSEYPTVDALRRNGYVRCDQLGLWSVVCHDYPEMLLLEYGEDNPRLPNCKIIGNVHQNPELLNPK